MRLWLLIVTIIGIPIFILSLSDYLHHSSNANNDNWVGIIVPLALVAWGFILPGIGRLIGRGDERLIREFIQNTLAARAEESAGIKP